MKNLKDSILVLKIGRNKNISSFARQAEKSRYIQHFPGGYKIESEVPAGTPVPFQTPPLAPFGAPFPMTPYGAYPGAPYGGYSYAQPFGYPPHHPYFGGYGYGYNGFGYNQDLVHSNLAASKPPILSSIAQSYQQFMDFISQRDKMKEHLDKQTESLNSLKNELETMKKGEYEFSEKVRHGQKQIIPITRSKR